MAHQTAVEWLVEQILLKHPMITQYLPDYSFDKSIVEQANKMFEEQIINAWMATENELQRIAAEQYYKETYGKDSIGS